MTWYTRAEYTSLPSPSVLIGGLLASEASMVGPDLLLNCFTIRYFCSI